MDRAAQLASSSNFGVFKEPRGFIRILEFFLAIFAFATTTSHSSYSAFTVDCPAGTQEQKLEFGYPYRLTKSAQFDVPICNATKTGTSSPCCDYNSSAEFYVFVGVMAWLYVLAITVYYVLFDDRYRENENIPTADFIVTAFVAAAFLIASSAWAGGVDHLKHYINPNTLIVGGRVTECETSSGLECAVTAVGNFAKLNVSLIFGYLNVFVWAGNCWFLYKETKWYPKQDAMYRDPTPAFGEEEYSAP